MITKTNSLRSLNWPFRLRASLIHLCGSASLAIIIAAIIFNLWYPGPYRSMCGGTKLFLVLVSVDVAIGPLITLVVFDRRKPTGELRRDLAVILLLQAAALGYGLHAVSLSRPVVVALEKDRFRVVAAKDVYSRELPTATDRFRNLSLTGPVLVRSIVPIDPKERSDSLSLALHGYDIGTRPTLWREWDNAARKEALANAKPLSALVKLYPKQQMEIRAAVVKTGRSIDQLVFIPMITFRGEWVALLAGSDGHVVGFAPLNGFPR